MPADNLITAKYIKQVIVGEKDWLLCSEVVHCNPPYYDEVSVKNLYDYAMTLPGMALYFPSQYAKGQAINRDYFFCIMATKQPEYYAKLVR